jgi:putative FmdB family regulatory protein
MPIYEYKCDMCGNKFERLTKDRKIEAYHCPYCEKNGKDALAFKIISRTNFKVNGHNASNGYSKTG